MLDDVGTKAMGLDAFAGLLPTWAIETSEGNYQCGFVLENPMTDGKQANRLMTTLIDAGYSDPGSTGPMSRLARLPKAVNGKHAPAFTCRLVIWNPTQRYSPEALLAGLGLTMPEPLTASKAKAAAAAAISRGDDIYTPKSPTNPVISEMQTRGIYKADLGKVCTTATEREARTGC